MTNTTSASVKYFTQRDSFNAIKAYFADGTALPEGFDPIEFCDGRIAQLDKKSASAGGEHKPTANQQANEVLKEGILANMEDGVLYAIGDMLKTFTCFTAETSSQKVNALVSQLVKAGKVERVEEKRKAYFRKVISD